MRVTRSLLPLLCLAVVQCSATPTDSTSQKVAAAINGPIALSTLGVGDLLTVHLDSEGCFYHWAGNLTFEVDQDGNLQVSGDAAPIVFARALRDIKVVPGIVAPAFVPSEQLNGLDRVLTRLRAPQTGYCTTQTDYRFALYKDGTLVHEEHLHDSVCGGLPDEDPVSFYHFLGAALEQADSATFRARPGA